MDAVGELCRLRLLLRRQQRPLPHREHGCVRVLAPIRHGRDVHEGDRHAERRGTQRLLRQSKYVHVRAHGDAGHVGDRKRLLGALDSRGVAPVRAPASIKIYEATELRHEIQKYIVLLNLAKHTLVNKLEI